MNDLEFVRRCVKNDASAWDEFIQRYSKLIYNYIHSVLRSKAKEIPKESREDLYQEIILSLIKDDYKKLKTFKAKNGCSLASWLRIVTVHFTIDYLRRRKPIASLDEELEEGLSLKDMLKDDSHLKLEEGIAKAEKQRNLSECIEGLSTDDQYFLEFYIGQELGLDELTAILRLSRAAVEMRRSRITQRLKECFEKKGFLLEF